MLPALPTGRQCTSGASPRVSQISNAAVFWPSIRNGLTLLTSDTGYLLASSRASSRQSSKLPSTCNSRAPCTSACASLPMAILPLGTRTAHTRPLRAAYAAALAEVLPVEAQMTARLPSSTALENATVIPRSLKDPVGLAPSTLRWTSQSVSDDRCGAGTSGVPPSRKVMIGVCSVTGSRCRYSLMTPSRLARRHQGVPTPAPRDRAHPDHHFARGRYAAGAGAASVVADGLRGPPQGGGGQPNWVLQGPRDDGRILQGGGGRQSGGHLRLHRQLRRLPGAGAGAGQQVPGVAGQQR